MKKTHIYSNFLLFKVTYLNGVQVSLNTGFTSTMYSSGSTVLARQAELVTAHGQSPFVVSYFATHINMSILKL